MKCNQYWKIKGNLNINHNPEYLVNDMNEKIVQTSKNVWERFSAKIKDAKFKIKDDELRKFIKMTFDNKKPIDLEQIPNLFL